MQSSAPTSCIAYRSINAEAGEKPLTLPRRWKGNAGQNSGFDTRSKHTQSGTEGAIFDMKNVTQRWAILITIAITAIGGTATATGAQDAPMQSTTMIVLDCETDP